MYTPNSGFVGTDTFTYRVLDSLGGASNFTTVTVQVIDQLPPPPDAVDDAAQTFKNETITINVLDNDLNVTTIAALTTPPSQGGTVAILNQVQVQYTPPPDSAARKPSSTRSETVAGTDTATVTVTVPNRNPVAADDTASTTAALAVAIPVLANDHDDDGDVLPITNVTHGANGTVQRHRWRPRVHAERGFTGTDTFDYTIDDGWRYRHGHGHRDRRHRRQCAPTAVIAGGDRISPTATTSRASPSTSTAAQASIADGEISGCEWTVNGDIQDVGCGVAGAVQARRWRQHGHARRVR